jgi:hypothetical protein
LLIASNGLFGTGGKVMQGDQGTLAAMCLNGGIISNTPS